MTAAEWGRTGPAAPAAEPADSRWNGSLAAVAEYAAAGLVLALMSGALLGPVFDPEQTGEIGWLRTLWLPIYGLVLLLAVCRIRSLQTLAVPALLTAPLLLLAFVSTEWSILPDVTVRRSVALTFTTLFGLWLAARFSWREVVGLVAGVFLLLAVGSCLAALLAPDIGVHPTVHAGAWRGLWYEKNALGGVMVLGVLACVCAARLAPGANRLWLCGAALCAGLVVMSTSTTSLLALGIIVGGFAIIGGMRRGAASAVTTVWIALVAAGAVAGVVALAPDLVFEALGKDPTLTGRTEIWDAVLRQVQERPVLGYGYGAFWEDKAGPVGFVRNEVNWSAPTAHNGWLELLLSCGWTGVALFAVHLLVVAAGAVVSIQRGPQAYWALIFLALFVLFSLSESTILQQNNLSWALYVMTGAKLLQRRAPEVVRQAAAPARAAAPAARLAYAAPLAVPAALPAAASNTWSLVLAGVMLIVFSKTWMLVALGGGRVPWDGPAWLQAVFLPAYGIGAILALQRFPSALAAAARSPALLSLILLAGLSAGWSVAPTTTLLGAGALAATTLAAFALASRFEWSDLVETVAVVFAVLTVGSVVAGLVIPGLGHDPNHAGNWRGLWFSKNSLGGNMAHAFLIFCSAALFRPRRAWLWWGMAALSLLPLLMSGSKTALAAWLLGAAAFAFVGLVRRGAAAGVIFTYAALLGAAVLAALVMFSGDSLAALAGKDTTLTGRTDIWDAALRQVGERPLLGFGYSAFWEAQEGATAWVRNDAGWKVTDAHNAWLEVWLGLGLVGLMLWCFVFAGAWVRSLMSVYRHGSAYFTLPWLAVFTVTAFSESVALRFNELGWLTFVMIAVKLSRWGEDPLAAPVGHVAAAAPHTPVPAPAPEPVVYTA